MRRIKNPYDITEAPIRVHDYLVMLVDNHQHHFKVLDVQGEISKGRTIKVRRIASSDPAMRSAEYEFPLQPGNAVMGVVIPEEQYVVDDGENTFEDAADINRLAVGELIGWLSGLDHAGCRASFSSCVEYLVKINVLPRQDYAKNKRYLSKLIAAHSDIFKNAGSYVHLREGHEAATSVIHDPTQSYVRISQYHLNQAIRHLLMSGLLTGGRPVQLVDTGLEPKQ